jgi:large subunit ribosomal protein L21
MYAVIKSGGKQYRVEQGDTIRVEKIEGKVGEKVIFNNVLMIKGDKKNPKVGNPLVKGGVVEAEILQHGRGKKIRVYTYKRRKGYEKTRGHRQDFTEVRIGKIKTTKKK